MEESIIYAKKYLEDLLSFFGLNIDVYATSEDEVISLSVPSTHMNGFLIGQRGDTMRALQYTVSSALKNNDYEYCRVNVDIADYKKGRQNRLAQTAVPWIEKVKSTGKPFELRPMNPADRRVVHKVADEYGLTTESVGFGRDRHVIIKPHSEEIETKEIKEEPEETETKDKEEKAKKSKKVDKIELKPAKKESKLKKLVKKTTKKKTDE
jgi:spoIIIJ-associated protein